MSGLDHHIEGGGDGRYMETGMVENDTRDDEEQWDKSVSMLLVLLETIPLETDRLGKELEVRQGMVNCLEVMIASSSAHSTHTIQFPNQIFPSPVVYSPRNPEATSFTTLCALQLTMPDTQVQRLDNTAQPFILSDLPYRQTIGEMEFQLISSQRQHMETFEIPPPSYPCLSNQAQPHLPLSQDHYHSDQSRSNGKNNYGVGDLDMQQVKPNLLQLEITTCGPGRIFEYGIPRQMDSIYGCTIPLLLAPVQSPAQVTGTLQQRNEIKMFRQEIKTSRQEIQKKNKSIEEMVREVREVEREVCSLRAEKENIIRKIQYFLENNIVLLE